MVKLGKNSQPPLTPPPCGGWELCELGNNVRNLDPPFSELGNFVKNFLQEEALVQEGGTDLTRGGG